MLLFSFFFGGWWGVGGGWGGHDLVLSSVKTRPRPYVVKGWHFLAESSCYLICSKGKSETILSSVVM